MKPPPQQLEPLTVALRVRPMSQAEYRNGDRQIAHRVDENLVVLMDPFEDADDILRANRSREKKYYFDMTFGPQSTQRAVYQYAVVEKNIIDSIIGGYNCTVFAYGATGAGKTYTMLGTETDPGIMALTLNDLFQKIEDTKQDMIYRVTMAYLEIYNEMIRDLLCPSSEVLELFEDSTGEIVVNNLVEVETTSTSEVMKLLQRGNWQRTCEPTAANKTSSRSHAILKVTVEQRSRVMDVSQDVRTGVLFMVDLAGSERARVTKNRGKRFTEGAHINRSLLALANCINALSSSNTNYVNYRDSKLTRLLRDALGGNCKTVMIAHVSPSSKSFEESRNTLSYAEIGKKIKNRTRQNVTEVKYHITQYHCIIKELQEKVSYLQSRLDEQPSGGGGGAEGGAKKESSKVHSLCQQLKEFIQEEKEIRQELLSLEYKLLQNAMECQKHLGRINEWEQKRSSLEVTSTLAPIPQGTSILELTIPRSAEPITEGLGDDACIIATEQHLNDASLQEEPTLSLGVEQQPSSVHMSISPDSGTAELSASQVEPFMVSSSREELSTLVADKQRMEAQHRRLERKVKENKSKVLEINEKLSGYPDLLPVRRDLIELLQHSYELEASNIEHHLTSALMSIQLAKHESMIETLLKHSEQLLGVIEHQRWLMEEQHVPLPVDLGLQCQELSDRQKSLQLQVTAEKKPPLLGREMRVKLPNIARLSARLYPTMTASKSNLFVRDDTPTEVEETNKDLSPLAISDIRLPSLTSLETHLSPVTPPVPLVQNDSELLLPPIDTTKQPSLVAVKPDSLTSDLQSPGLYPTNHTKQPDISLIVEAARKARQRKSDLQLHSTSGKRALPSPKKILNKVPSFTGPRISISRCSARTKNKYIVSRVKVRRNTNTVVFDCEIDDNKSLPDQPELKRRDSVASIASKTQSQPFLSPKHISKQSHKRTRTLPFSRSVLSDSTRRSSKHREGRKVITLEELEKIYHRPPKKTTSSTHSTPIHKSVCSHVRKTTESTTTTPLHKAGFKSKQTPVHTATSSGLLVHSTRSTRHPFIPVAHRIPAASRRRLPLTPTVKRHVPLRRRELALAKVNASSQFSSVSSPYLTPLRQPKKQGKGHASKSEKK